MDLRKNLRYRLGASVVFRWEGSPGNRLRGEGLTRDVSLAGAFVFTSASAELHAISVGLKNRRPWGHSASATGHQLMV
jgi:hypothetical protein